MNLTIRNYLSGRGSVAEQKELLDWIRKEDHLAEFQSLKVDWKNEIVKEDLPAGHHQTWKKIQDQLFDNMQTNMNQVRRTLKFFRYAAIFLLLVSVPSLVYLFTQSRIPDQLFFTTVSADFGQISKVLLPDSSIIWVNSGSMIKYNNQFPATNRNVELVGEAFFKVRRNPEIPMVVSSANLKVKVLGTEFSISAYPEESNIEVVLEKGKVELTSFEDVHFRQEMKPGELASFSKGKRELAISSVNTELYTSWKDGLINIYNLPLSKLVVTLEKRYNQKFEVDEAIKKMPYTFTIKNEELSSVLTLMEKITPIEAIQHGNVIELRYNKKIIKH